MLKRIPQFPRNEKRSIFITFPKPDNSVSELTSSQVNKAIQRIWRLGPIEKPISATRLRKSTATNVRAVAPEVREPLAKHMNHDPATADTYYHVYDQRENAKPMCQLIASVMEGTKPTVQQSIHWPKEIKEKNHSAELQETDRDSDKTIDYYSDLNIVGPASPVFSDKS